MTATPAGRGLGWLGRSPEDLRDYRMSFHRITDLPAAVDLTDKCPPVLDQGPEGSCTAHAAAVAAYATYVTDGWHHPFPPSPRFIYYAERQLLEAPPYNITAATQQDTGGYTRAVVAAIARYGITAEHNCPYRDATGDPRPLLAVPPDAFAYTNAHKHLATTYWSLPQDVPQLQACLADGYTFLFGFAVYLSFESPVVEQTGIVPMPRPGDVPIGGHELACIGYETIDGTLYFRCRNSWGPAFGQGGDVFMPAAYLADPALADDLWTIRVQK